MKTSDFDYDLPHELIAQYPLKQRDASRLLIYGRESGQVKDAVFSDIIEHINPGDALVLNRTKVLPARFFGVNANGSKLEFLLLKRLDALRWECLVKPGKRAKEGARFSVSDELTAIIEGALPSGGRVVRFEFDGVFEEILGSVGQMPLPPYIKQKLDDAQRYQTVYAKETGSAAAPTAGLHFTPELLACVAQKGVDVIEVLLHVGLGTFRPVKEDELENHRMHEEYYEVSEDAARRIAAAKQRGGRIICVGTTSVRTLESAADATGAVAAKSGWTDIFITPGYRFKTVDALITNFHLPKSTLLMLVSAFASKDAMLSLYAHAVQERYRFFSFGDAMLIL